MAARRVVGLRLAAAPARGAQARHTVGIWLAAALVNHAAGLQLAVRWGPGSSHGGAPLAARQGSGSPRGGAAGGLQLAAWWGTGSLSDGAPAHRVAGLRLAAW